ncbi:pseudouridine synthase, partial [Janibacter sp. RAF20_2_2]
NDGDLAHRLQHPAHGVLKTYIAEIPGPVPKDLGKRLRDGVELEDGPVRVDSFKVVDSRPGKAIVEVILHEGRKHIVRRMLDHVGHPVLSLVRTQVGPITLGTTKSGRWRNLSRQEISDLYKAAGL